MNIWRDGTWRDTSESGSIIEAPAFQYGFGLFETVRLRGGSALDIEDHIGRLLRSIAALDAESPRPFSESTLAGMIAEASKLYEQPDGVLKIIARRLASTWDIVLLTRPYTYSPQDYAKGFSLTRSQSIKSARGLLANHKTLNYLENYLERRKAAARGFKDAYFINSDGIVTESTSANIFLLSDGAWRTSPIDAGLLPGIMRAKLLRMADAIGLAAAETPLTPELLSHAESVFVTNALYGAMPISRIDDRIYNIDSGLVERLNIALGRWSI